ncbi:MAG: hypothetical protein LBK01_02295 [Burkholderiaceae bacterium]|nr:hypothetical protein [Burkholderiaceae bacterium]
MLSVAYVCVGDAARGASVADSRQSPYRFCHQTTRECGGMKNKAHSDQDMQAGAGARAGQRRYSPVPLLSARQVWG